MRAGSLSSSLVLTLFLFGCTGVKYDPPVDMDGDGYLFSEGDCNDEDASIFPGAPELCDLKDNDCDGNAESLGIWYQDDDGDGHGAVGQVGTPTCNPGPELSPYNDDCDDGNDQVFPGAVELCDGLDNDCNNLDDDRVLWYPDEDGDGFGAGSTPQPSSCPGEGFSPYPGDCDDQRPDIHPGAAEVCDPEDADEDCDQLSDEADPSTLDVQLWYPDADGDGFGDENQGVPYCDPQADLTTIGEDCNDGNPSTWPGAPESCESGLDSNCDDFHSAGDNDGDGFAACEECDDGDDAIHPDALETCNDLDDNCDGNRDEEAIDAALWYPDLDLDGYGDSSGALLSCSAPEGMVSVDGDCSDLWAEDHPGATELCDGRDNDCNGTIDDADLSNQIAWYPDHDRDGYGNPDSPPIYSCAQPTGYAPNGDDCDDDSPVLNPETWWYPDQDSDHYGEEASGLQACLQPSTWIQAGGDCEDGDATINPGETEYCDGIDNDCSGTVDDSYAVEAVLWYQDIDSDGYGNSSVSLSACTQPAGYVSEGGDCEDAEVTIWPGAPEFCDSTDNDCNGVIDDNAVDAYLSYPDSDRDGYGDESSPLSGCTTPSGWLTTGGDCDDVDNQIHPAASEYCNGYDDDCDGSIDEPTAVDASTWYLDDDGDGYGWSSSSQDACEMPAGYAALSGDCDDTDSTSSPAILESCNGKDDDCDGSIDESDASDAQLWYVDADGDGYGAGTGIASCSAISGRANVSGDCNDALASQNPAAVESCNGIDDNCDGSTDGSDASDATAWYIDSDGDGWGDDSTVVLSCYSLAGRITAGSDCDDSDSSSYPGASETWYDGVDSDCDGAEDPSVCLDVPELSFVTPEATCSVAASGAWSLSLGWESRNLTFSTSPGFTHMGSSPLVGQLNDDNGDGVLDAHDTPDLVWTAGINGTNGSKGCLRVVDGASRTELSSTCSVGAVEVNAAAGAAIGDLEGDGVVEIITAAGSGGTWQVVALHATGAQVWATTTGSAASLSPPSIVNIDGGGTAEVLAGSRLLDSSGALMASFTSACNYSFAADLDQDGQQEVICAGMVYGKGSSSWSNTSSNGWTAAQTGGFPGVADLDGNGTPEVVQSYNGTLYVYSSSGTAAWDYAIPGASSSGVPVLADYDGDGVLDIGVSRNGGYAVVSGATHTQLWSVTTAGNQIYGSTAADLNGDGNADVIYADSATFYILDGASGSTLYSQSSYAGTQGTLASPVVADYDGDGNAEILVPSSNVSSAADWDGLKILEEDGDLWGSAPLLWTGYFGSYSAVDQDMSIPTTPDAPWLGENLFRAAAAPSGDPQGSADLRPWILGGCQDCSGGLVDLYVVVENIGVERAGGEISVSLYSNDGGTYAYLDSMALGDDLLSGERSAPLVFTLGVGDVGADGLRVIVDDDGTGTGQLQECDESNNVEDWGEEVCP